MSEEPLAPADGAGDAVRDRAGEAGPDGALDVLPDVPPPEPPLPGRVRLLGSLAAAAVGMLLGLLGAFVQADRSLVGSLALPWGTVLVLVTLLLCVRGAAWAVRTRWAGAALFAGWLVATVLLATETPSGDLALSGGGRQQAYLFGGVVLGSAAATIPLLPRRERRAVRPAPTGGPDEAGAS